MSEIKKEFTNRGFYRGNFTDALGEGCSVQESSSASEERIWLGIDEPKLTAMSINVPKLSPIEWVPDEGSTKTTGWSTAILPKDAHIFGRMELNREMCRRLGRILTRFAETGELSFDDEVEKRETRYSWSICKHCSMPFLPYKENQAYCGTWCEMKDGGMMARSPSGMDKYLFLDIDGVLNCRASATYYDPDAPDLYGIDEKCWENVQRIIEAIPEVKVVMHTGWVKWRGDPSYRWDFGKPTCGASIQSLLHEVMRRLGPNFHDCVKYVQHMSKYYKILNWLRENNLLDEAGRKVNAKVAVLDDDWSLFQGLVRLEKYDNLSVVFTDREVGLDKSRTDEVINFLKGESTHDDPKGN